MSGYEYRSPDLAGHDTYDSAEDVQDALARSGARIDWATRIERRKIGPWESVAADLGVALPEPTEQAEMADKDEERERLMGIHNNGDWPKYLDARARMFIAEAERDALRALLDTLNVEFLARRDAIKSDDHRGTPGRRARSAWEDAARTVRARRDALSAPSVALPEPEEQR